MLREPLILKKHPHKEIQQMIRIVIAGDQEILLGVIQSLLNLEEDMEVVGQAGNGEEVLQVMDQFQPDVCIMDLEMPGTDGLAAAEILTTNGYKVIILATFSRIGNYERALHIGVQGYLLKDSPSEDLVSSIRSIMLGKQIYSSELRDQDPSDDLVLKEGIKQSNITKNVTKYLTTFMNKIKLPTG